MEYILKMVQKKFVKFHALRIENRRKVYNFLNDSFEESKKGKNVLLTGPIGDQRLLKTDVLWENFECLNEGEKIDMTQKIPKKEFDVKWMHNDKVYALKVPFEVKKLSIRGIQYKCNGKGSHGDGDYIVFPLAHFNELPVLSEGVVVNGLIFKHLFGWDKNIDKTVIKYDEQWMIIEKQILKTNEKDKQN